MCAKGKREIERESWRICVITWDWMCQVISTSVKESWGGETGNLMSRAASQLISGEKRAGGGGGRCRDGWLEEGWRGSSVLEE